MKPNSPRKKKKAEEVSAPAPPVDLPALPSLLTQPLGLEGWTNLEPVLLAALASEEPLLLIGQHGSAKSFLLERLAQTLELKYRFYNASLINYDDLVGIPMPDEERKSLRYISTPTAIWDAEVVFLDEINRTRPELQNKLFPIIHERRVQGNPLEQLRYRWAAMNPPPAAEEADEAIDVYLGTEPLDPALADRFPFIIKVPGWQQLSDEQRRKILREQFSGPQEFAISPLELVASARRHFEALKLSPPPSLEDYLITLILHLVDNKIHLSVRRVSFLQANILAIQAARMALYEQTFPDLAKGVDWKTSALLALQNGLPQAAHGRDVDQAVLLGAHRHAWEVSKLDGANPWGRLLKIAQPLERLISAVRINAGPEIISELIPNALASESNASLRTALSLVVYVRIARRMNLDAFVMEMMARELRNVIVPYNRVYQGRWDINCPRHRVRQVEDLCKKLLEEVGNGSTERNRYANNLLQGLLPDGYEHIPPSDVLNKFNYIWDAMGDAAENE